MLPTVGALVAFEAVAVGIAQAAPNDPTSPWNWLVQLPIAAVAVWFCVRADRRAEAALEAERASALREIDTAREALPIVVECTEALKDVAAALQGTVGTVERVQRTPMGSTLGPDLEAFVARLNDALDAHGG